MELFCETSWIFELDSIKNEARHFLNFRNWQHQKQSNSARLPSKMESWVELTASCQCVLCSICPKYLACEEKVMPGHTYIRSAAPVTQNHPNISDEHVSCTAPATRNASLQIFFKSSNVPRLPTFLKLLQNPHVLLTFGKVPNPLRLPRKITPRDGHFLSPFDFHMCFAPQRCAIFQHLNFQKCSVTSKSASRRDCMQFFISHLARWLRTRRFSKPTFRPSGAPRHWKKCSVSRLFYLSRPCIFFLLTLSLLWSSFFFSSLTLPTSAFSSVHIVGSLTSKLPS